MGIIQWSVVGFWAPAVIAVLILLFIEWRKKELDRMMLAGGVTVISIITSVGILISSGVQNLELSNELIIQRYALEGFDTSHLGPMHLGPIAGSVVLSLFFGWVFLSSWRKGNLDIRVFVIALVPCVMLASFGIGFSQIGKGMDLMNERMARINQRIHHEQELRIAKLQATKIAPKGSVTDTKKTER